MVTKESFKLSFGFSMLPAKPDLPAHINYMIVAMSQLHADHRRRAEPFHAQAEALATPVDPQAVMAHIRATHSAVRQDRDQL